MSLDEFQHLADFDFVKHFGITMHTFELDISNWNTEEILADVSQGFKTVKWTYWTKNAVIVIVKSDEKTWCWKEHREGLNLSSEEVAKIKRITSDFKERVRNMEKYIIFAQERIHFITLKEFESLLGNNSKEINSLKNKLDLKISDFHTVIQNLKKSRSIDLLFDSKKSFDGIKQTAIDIIDEIFDLYKEKSKESLHKVIKEDLDYSYQNENQYEEESKGEKFKAQSFENKNGKLLDILFWNYIPSTRALNFQNEVRELLNYSKKIKLKVLKSAKRYRISTPLF